MSINILKTSVTAFLLFAGASFSFAQIKDGAKDPSTSQKQQKFDKPYNPNENAKQKIATLVKKAKTENKNILIQGGGNWCIWCLRFHQYIQNNPELKKLVDENYLYYHLNYSRENKNADIFASYGNPQDKYGFPVFIILDKNGKLIHIQDSSVLEDGANSYDFEKVKDFLLQYAIGSTR